jgi:single-strand DNA-binding protein
MLNKVQIIGRVGRDPEVRFLPSGQAVCNFSLATTEKWKDKNTGEMQEATEWHRITAFDRLAEIIGEYVRQGGLIYVEGKLTTRKYTDKDGAEKSSTEIRAGEMKLLSSKQDGGNQAAPAQRQQQGGSRSSAPRQTPAQPQQRPAVPPASSSGFDDMDDDIPFVSCEFGLELLTSKAKRMVRYDF